MQATRSVKSKLLDFSTALLRLLPAELAHDIGMTAMKQPVFTRLLPGRMTNLPTALKTTVPGIGELSHPVALAAGFDKHALAPFAFAQLGFAALEIGTVTPRAQSGNPKPRMFRDVENRAIINRMGFNSEGSQTVLERLEQLNWPYPDVPIGINVGKNKNTSPEDAPEDFSHGLKTFKSVADYFVINISSPNTAGLRDLANADFLEILARDNRELLPKMWVKLDPDMPRQIFQDCVATIQELGYQGLVLSNTHKVSEPEAGGLSGHPLMSLSNRCLEWAYAVHKGELPIIASGGVLSGLDVLEKIRRGAHFVQIYSALVYRGPTAVQKILSELQAEMSLQGIEFLSEARGSHYD